MGLPACTGGIPTWEAAGSSLYASQALSLYPAAAGTRVVPLRVL